MLRVLGLVGDREVGDQSLQLELRPSDDVAGQRDGVVWGGADPVHAGVDLEVDPHRTTRCQGHLAGQPGHGLGPVHEGPEPQRDHRRVLVG